MTIKIQFASDLHADWYENYQWCRDTLKPCAKVLLLAGDTVPYVYKKREKFIKSVLLPKWHTIIEVPGNHDHYGMPADWEGAAFVSELILDGGHAYHYKHNSCFESLAPDGRVIRIICSTLWSNVVERPYEVAHGLNDYKMIKGYTIDLNNQRHKACVEFLDRALSETPDGMVCIVLTHHLPLMKFIDETFIGNPINEAYATDLYSLINKHAGKIKAWVMGHSHSYREDVLGGIRFVRNPLGYPPSVGSKYFGQPRTFKMDAVIEV